MVPAHREHRDPGRREAIDPAAKIAVGLVEVVFLLDDVAGEQHRVHLGLQGEVDGEPPGRSRPQLARPELVQHSLRQARRLPAEMDVTDAKKLHHSSRPCAGSHASMVPFDSARDSRLPSCRCPGDGRKENRNLRPAEVIRMRIFYSIRPKAGN